MDCGSSGLAAVPAALTVEVGGAPYRWVGTLVLEQVTTTVPAVIQQAMQYIEDHIQDPNLSLAAVARSVPVSKSYLARRFRQVCGMTCNSYIAARRAQR